MKERVIPSELIEMPCWYYEKKNLKVTPSIKDGLSFETERRYRKEGARFIISCGTAMGLGHNTMATGVVYFHRFYMFHSFKSFPRYVTACCCLLLAGKVEETPKKCRDIIKSARGLLTDTQFFSFGEDPKEEVMTLERILLQTIKFDLQVEHPYNLLVKYAKCLKGDQTKLQKMVQMAWNFVNDSLSTTVCLQWEPEIIAVALIHLASKLSKFSVADWVGRQPHHLRWWDMFVSNVTMEILEDICHQVLDLYQHGNQETGDTSPPQKPQSRVSSPQMKRPKSPLDPPPPPQGRPPVITKPRPPETITSASQMSKSVPQPPAPDLLHYMYSSSYANMYTHGHSSQHYPPPPMPGTSMPAPAPPLPPPMYANYLTTSESMHYTSGLPPLPSSRIPQPQPPPPSTSSIGYYQQQTYSHGRHRFAPPQ